VSKEKKFEKHAIQLEKIVVNEASLKLTVTDVSGTENKQEPKFFVGKSEFDKTNHTISIGFMVRIDGDHCGYTCLIDLIGIFSVDENKFNITQLDEWGDKNAPFILLPYIREYLFNLTLTYYGEGYILPLIEIPTSGKPILQSD